MKDKKLAWLNGISGHLFKNTALKIEDTQWRRTPAMLSRLWVQALDLGEMVILIITSRFCLFHSQIYNPNEHRVGKAECQQASMVAQQMNSLSDIMLVWQAVFSWNYPQGVCGVWRVFAAMSDFFRHRGGS